MPRPRRFGKTLNFSMLRYFFDNSLPENEGLFKHLKIWQTENEIKEKQGKYPVIYLSFKDAKDQSWENCLELIIGEIVDLFTTHIYLIEKDLLADHEKNEFLLILNKKAKDTTYQRSLKKLSQYLQRYNNQKRGYHRDFAGFEGEYFHRVKQCQRLFCF